MTGTLEYRIASCGDKYRPEFRRSPTERWWFKRGMEFPTSTAAMTAARNYVELDEASRTPAHIIELETEPLGNVEDWRRDKDAALQAERGRVFGFTGPKVVRDCKGNHVEVVTKGRARA